MFATIGLLRERALALRSSVHNEQCLSAVELAGMVAKKTNELIDVVNTLCDVVESVVDATELVLVYDEATETLSVKHKEV